MNILVFVKRVPDTESRIRIQHETRTIAEDGLNFVISPYDEYAVEEALRLKEAKGGTVRVVAVGRDEAAAVLRKCLAMGADEAVLVKDDAPGDVRRPADGPHHRPRGRAQAGRGRSPALRQAVGRGRQQPGAGDGRRAARPAPGDRRDQARDRRRFGHGPPRDRRRPGEGRLTLPAVVTAQKGLNEPRYETLKGIMAAKKKPVPVVTLDELGFGPDDLAVRGRDRRARRAGRAAGGPGPPGRSGRDGPGARPAPAPRGQGHIRGDAR